MIILHSGCNSQQIYRRTFISPTVSAAHRGNITQPEPKVRLSSLDVNTSPCICMKCLSTMLTIRLSHANNSHEHIYPRSSLHPSFNVLHYPNNRVGNYEKFLIKRLFSFSKKLFNCSTHPYQGKSRCPCQKIRVLLTTRHQRTVFHWKVQVQSSSRYRCLLGQSGDMKWKSYLLTEPSIGSSAVKRCFVCETPCIARIFSRRQRSRKGTKVIDVPLWRNTIKYKGA